MVAASNNPWISLIKLQKYTHIIDSIIPIKFLLKPILYDSQNFKPHYFHYSRCVKLLSKRNKIHTHYNHICDCNIDLYSRDQKFPQRLINPLLISCQMSGFQFSIIPTENRLIQTCIWCLMSVCYLIVLSCICISILSISSESWINAVSSFNVLPALAKIDLKSKISCWNICWNIAWYSWN